MLEIDKGSTRPYSVENLLRKRLWTCLKIDWNEGTVSDSLGHDSHFNPEMRGTLQGAVWK